MALRRLQTEHKIILKRKDLANFVASPEEKDIHIWHFLVFGLQDCPYEGGYYWGTLIFPRDYPFKPPRIKYFTPQGRFEVNYPVCTSFSDYHPESWDPSWSVQTIVLGLISFMLSDEMTAGGIRTTTEKKVKLAKESLAYCFKKEEQFVELFGDYFEQIGIDPVTKKAVPPVQPANNNGAAAAG